MTQASEKLSFREKAGYSLGDAAANFVFQTMILFQLNFYTDTMGITAAVAGTILLVGRLWDAFFDPMMGVIADRTNTRWGKFRPWVLWTALPWGAFMVLAYTKPDFGPAGLIFYAAFTNIALMTLYSMNNTPYSALSGVMTGDGNERTSLSSFRFVAAMIAQLIVGGFTLPLVAKFGQGDAARGWQMTMALWAAVCVACFLITFLSTRERIQPDPNQKLNAKEDFAGLLRNGPWIAMFTLTLVHFAVLAMRGGTLLYYFQYYVDKQRLFEVLAALGLTGEAAAGGAGRWLLETFGLLVNAERTNVASVGYSLFNMSSQAVTVVGVLCSTLLAMRYGKKAVALAGFALTTLFMAAFALVPATSIGAMLALEYLRVLSYGPTIPLLWAMFADVADYAEWKTGRRITGTVFATIIFALKAGLSLGGALAGWLLSAYGYQPNVEQSAEALQGIRLTVSAYPALLFAIVILCLARYPIGRKLNLQIQEELAERRRAMAQREAPGQA